jgi:Trk-type K+ transport system membrane component
MFLVGCVGARLLLTYGAKEGAPLIKTAIAIFCILAGIGFWSIYLFGWRKTGPETNQQKIWWNSLRPLHGTLYLLAGVLLLLKYSYAWAIILLDLAIGLTAFTLHHLN